MKGKCFMSSCSQTQEQVIVIYVYHEAWRPALSSPELVVMGLYPHMWINCVHASGISPT